MSDRLPCGRTMCLDDDCTFGPCQEPQGPCVVCGGSGEFYGDTCGHLFCEKHDGASNGVTACPICRGEWQFSQPFVGVDIVGAEMTVAGLGGQSIEAAEHPDPAWTDLPTASDYERWSDET